MSDSSEAAQRLGRSLKAWMDYARLNVTDLNKRTAIGRTTIHRIVKGDSRALPSVDTINRLAAEVGTTPGKLIDGVLPPTQTPIPNQMEARLKLLEEETEIFRATTPSVRIIASVLLSILDELPLQDAFRQRVRAELDAVN